MILRPYQNTILSSILKDLRQKQNLLIQAPTGSGKTIIFGELVRILLNRYDKRILILANRAILISQTKQKILSLWPEAEDHISIICSTITKKKDFSKKIIIATPQSLISCVDKLNSTDVIICDEAHRLPLRTNKSQYNTILTFVNYHSIIGFTATPYRLGYGNIYDDTKATWFDSLNSSFTIKNMQREKFLVPYVFKAGKSIKGSLNNIKKSHGDYNSVQLNELMSKPVHISSAVSVIEKYAKNRKKIVIFCVSIDHAELLSAYLKNSLCIHSKLKKKDRQEILDAFEFGSLRIICNVGILTEGWDCPSIDCIVLCRPTMSAVLYVQMVGRGLRPFEGKEDVLILDVSSNCQTHGDPNDPNLIFDNLSNEDEKKSITCEECRTIHFDGSYICSACGFVMKEESELLKQKTVDNNATVEMFDFTFKQKKGFKTIDRVINNINKVTFTQHKTKVSKKTIYKVSFKSAKISTIICFIDFNHNNKYVRRKNINDFKKLKSISSDFVFNPPVEIEFKKNNAGYYSIHNVINK